MNSREMIYTHNGLAATARHWLQVVADNVPHHGSAGDHNDEGDADTRVLATLPLHQRGLVAFASKQWHMYHHLEKIAEVHLKILPQNAFLDS